MGSDIQDVQRLSDSPDQVWVQLEGSDRAIRLRNLSLYQSNGGTLTDVRLVEDGDQVWTMWIRLSTRPGEYRLNQFRTDLPKTYKDVSFAIATIRDDLGYRGAITLVTDRPPPAPRSPVEGEGQG